MTEQIKHNDFNATQISHWLRGASEVSSSKRFFKLEDGSLIRAGYPIRFNGKATGIPKGKVIVKELRVVKDTHQVMAGLEYKGKLFYYPVCDFSLLVEDTPLPPERSPTQSEPDYGSHTEVHIGNSIYLLDDSDTEGLHDYLISQRLYSRNTGELV